MQHGQLPHASDAVSQAPQPPPALTEEQMRIAHEQQMQRDAEQHLLGFLGRPDALPPGSGRLDAVTRLQEKVDEVGGLFGSCVGQVWRHARPVAKGGALGEDHVRWCRLGDDDAAAHAAAA